MNLRSRLLFLPLYAFSLSLLASAGLAAESKKEAVSDKPAPSAPPTGQPQYILKDVTISFEGDDEAVPVLRLPKETETKKSAAAKKKSKKSAEKKKPSP